jgi:hypothetical protein
MSHRIEARMASLGTIGVAVKPGVLVGTRKPRMPSSVRAQMTAMSTIDARPMVRSPESRRFLLLSWWSRVFRRHETWIRVRRDAPKARFHGVERVAG